MPDADDTRNTPSPAPWFESWFKHPFYLEVYSHRDEEEAARCVATLLRLTGIGALDPAGLSVLDIACGAGRHALPLARLGYRVTANDLSPFLLDTARREAAQEGLALEFSCCDMRHIAPGSYDLIVQLFTSFGYFDNPEDDRLVLDKVAAALKPGGWYVLDLINPEQLERNLVPVSTRMAGRLLVEERRSIEDGRISKEITITAPEGESVRFRESVRLFSKEEITAMLEEAGLEPVRIAGDYEGGAWDRNSSPRMLLISRKAS